MFQHEANTARKQIAEGVVRFKRKGSLYWPDMLADRNALRLVGAKVIPSADPDNILRQLANTALWVEFT